MANEVVREERRASRAGYHFVNLYQQCPRKWYLHYALGIVPTKVGKALIFGKAWHEALAVYLTSRDEAAALAKGLDELELSKTEYRLADDFAVDVARMRKLLPLWVQWANGMLVEYDVLETEVEYKVPLETGGYMTIRPDAVLEHKANKSIFIAEHKSTTYSIDNMVNTVECQDQATAYSWGLCKARPEFAPRFGGVLVDVAYVRVAQGKLSESARVDGAVVRRTARDFAEFELSMIGLFNELGQKYLALQGGGSTPLPPPVPLLFPRNGNTCSLFGCEYQNICRSLVDKTTLLTDDFERDPAVVAGDRLLGEETGRDVVPC